MITIRPSEDSDREFLVQWLLQPGVLAGFPLTDVKEVEDASHIWLSYRKQGAVLTACVDGVPAGIANLYIQPYKKLMHQALFAIVVDEKFRNIGVGRTLIEALLKLGKEEFHLKFVHLEVYDDNPAIRLYERMGFEKYGVHPKFLKHDGRYWNKVLMQKSL